MITFAQNKNNGFKVYLCKECKDKLKNILNAEQNFKGSDNMNCPKCNTWLTLNIPKKSSKGLKGVKVVCKCGYKAECIDWNEYISRWREIK